VCIAVIAPTGFLMGQPFPLGIKWVRNHQPDSIPWLWAINGAASVVGSSLATIIALQTGFRSASLLGIVCYVLTFLVSTLVWRQQRRPAEALDSPAPVTGLPMSTRN
jgi:predicted MFS family arabinose efflux permease